MCVQDVSLRGFWLQKLMGIDKANESRKLIDYLLDLARQEKLKYEYVSASVDIAKTCHWLSF